VALHTASEVFSFAKRLEEDGARFYQELAKRFSASTDTFEQLAKENRKFSQQVERAYYGGISDALEGGFAFEIDQGQYELDALIPDSTTLSEALSRAAEMEGRIRSFYTDAAAQSGSLMADLPRAFSQVARRRARRLQTIEALQESAG
jgi:rubrerythrin